MNKPQPLDLEINIKPKLTYKWGNEEHFLHFKRGYEKGFKEAQEILKQEILQRIKSACEFYLRYKDRIDILEEEQPKYKKEISKFYSTYRGALIPNLDEYNEWLFRLAFKLAFRDVV